MVTSINYEEPHQDRYKSVKVGDKVFDSGDFIVDWFNSRKYITFLPEEESEIQMHSSSVDHFIMDGKNYDSAYLKPTENEGFELSYEYDEKGVEFFVPSGVKWVWEELKSYVKNKENESL